jgi:hypothetical protein
VAHLTTRDVAQAAVIEMEAAGLALGHRHRTGARRLTGGDMRRRAFVFGSVAMLAAPLGTEAERAELPRIGILATTPSVYSL